MQTPNAELVAEQLQKKIEDLAAQLDEAKAAKSQIDLLQHYQNSQKHDGWFFDVFFGQVPSIPESPRNFSSVEKLEFLKFYRSEIYFEWNLLSNRVTSYITSQSFLVTAFAISMGNSLAGGTNGVLWARWFVVAFPIILCVVGISTTLRVFPSIDAAIYTIGLWQDKQKDLLRDPELSGFQVQRVGKQDYGSPRFGEAVKSLIERIARRKREGADASVDYIHERSLHFAIYAPVIFMLMWIGLFLLVISLHVFVH